MSGQQHSPKLQSGKYLLNLTILLLAVCVLLFGCVSQFASMIPAPGRADWEIQLSDKYYIIRANSNSKKICKVTENTGLYENVLSYFYITKYQTQEQYIFLEGIPTADLFASDVEKNSDNRQYYLLDIVEERLWGPYDTENALLESDLVKNTGISVEWEILPK